MLIGYVLYYDSRSGARTSELDTDVTAEYAQRASDASTVAVWHCRNGDQNDVRYFRDKKPWSAAEVQAWLSAKGG